MNTNIARSGLVTIAMCGLALAACDSMKDVREDPFTAVPTPTVVLQGKINGLGNLRPLVLQNNGVDSCIDPANPDGARIGCRFYGTFDKEESLFSFGSVPVGSTYNVTVKTQPFGKQCVVQNGSGTLSSAEGLNITVTCENDPAVARYAVNGTISAAVAALPGAKVILTTEEGVREFDAAGQTAFSFPDAIFNSQSSLPIFVYTVTATFTENGTEYNCSVTNGTNDVGASTVPPASDVTNVSITACEFTAGGSVVYSTPPGGTSQTMPAGGMALALRDQAGNDVQTVEVNAFGSFSFPTPLRSKADAIYELVVTRHPEGQHCVVGRNSYAFAGGLWSLRPNTESSAVLLIDPTISTWWLYSSRSVNCRALPAEAAQLTGTFQTDQGTATSRPRVFLSLFEDGTFLYGIHNNTYPTSGVEHGFYVYDSVAGTIAFTLFVDTNGTSVGLSGTPSPTTTGSGSFGNPRISHALASAVATTPGPLGTLSLTFGASGASPVTWAMTEPAASPGLMNGAWATADHRRVWVYDFNSTFGFHMGVNGMGNLQDACYVLNQGTNDPSGYYTRRGGSTGCAPRGPTGTIDVPWNATMGANVTNPRVPPLLRNRMPGSETAFDGRSPSPTNYTVTSGSPDTLTVQPTLHGVPNAPAVTFTRTSAN